VIAFFLQYLQTRTLKIFIYYRILFGLGVLAGGPRFPSVLPAIDFSTSGMIPLGQLILWLICFGSGFCFGFGSVFELAGAASLCPPRRKGCGF
jgi:hypothetical protein